MKTLTVGSHVSLIDFGGAKIPIGFLASHRKPKHLVCETNRGFVVRLVQGKHVNQVCECAITRAAKRLRGVGASNFEKLGDEWKGNEMARVRQDEERCRVEGYNSADEAACPYPENSDQALAWQEGRQRRSQRGPGAEGA